MKLRLMSSGKGPVLSGQVNADLYIDCRGIVNPYRMFPSNTGDDEVVLNWMRKNNATYIHAAEAMIRSAVLTAGTRNSFKSDQQKPLTVCFFCLAGVHRSRSMKNVLYERLIQSPPQDSSGKVVTVEVVK